MTHTLPQRPMHQKGKRRGPIKRARRHDKRPFPPLVLDEANREWCPVAGFPDYEISNDGLLRRATDGPPPYLRGTVLTPTIGSAGYPKYNIYDRCGRRHTVNAHRLVGLAFLPPPSEGKNLVLHWNDNKLDVRVGNLRWGHGPDNYVDAVRNGGVDPERHSSKMKPWARPRGEEHNKSKLTEDQVREILHSKEKQRDLAQQYGVDQALIGRIRNGKVWKHITNPEYAAMLKRRRL